MLNRGPFLRGLSGQFEVLLQISRPESPFCKSCKFALFDFKFLSLCTVYLIIIFRVQNDSGGIDEQKLLEEIY